jgi:hypothetical protein
MITETYQIQNEILNVKFTDEIPLTEIISWLESITYERYPVKCLKIFGDATMASYQFNTRQIDLIALFGDQLCQKFSSIRIALVLSKPKETALTTLVGIKMHSENYHQVIFSDKENAMAWLVNPNNIDRSND